MYSDSDWMTDWPKAEAFSKRMGGYLHDDSNAWRLGAKRPYSSFHGVLSLSTRASWLSSSAVPHGKFASAKALTRPLIEAALRTLWIAETASDEKLSAVLKGRELPLLGELRTSLSSEKEGLFAGRLQGLLDTFTHGGTRAIAAQFIEGEVLDRGNAVMIALAGFSLGAAGYTIARLLERNDLLDQLSSAIPNVD